jgi:glutaminase
VNAGKNADYIPILAKVDPKLFAIVLVTANGEVYESGNVKHPFSIQSVSKVFTLGRILEDLGRDAVEKKVGTGATGQPFNSIIAIEMQKKDHPAGNPLVNPGAIASVSLVPGSSPNERWSHIIDTMSAFAGRPLTVDQIVYKSESDTNTRNRAISWLLKAYDVIPGDPMEALDLYTRQCSIAVTAHDLAIMGATLANGGVNPVTHKKVVSPETAAQMLSMMLTAGFYENTGKWSLDVGVPAKSGVGGGIVAVVPGRYAIGTFAPPLDEAGNSVRGQRAVESIVNDLGGNVFMAPRAAPVGSGN